MISEGVVIGGRYEILTKIGSGGMADVYKAMDHKLSRYVAMKILKTEFREDAVFIRKFQSEAQSAAGLSHPSIVGIYDVGEDRGFYYIVMEYVDGITLKDYIRKKGSLTPKEVISISVQVCSAIKVAHSHNIVHRDIKPQNIMISREGKVKVTDFGIAKATSSNTISTNAMGSVHYTSPEQARGGYSDAKSDIYSLGITMYEMITGRLPFDGDTTVAIALKHLQEEITPPSQYVPDIPYSLEQIILKCTQKSPDRRYANVTQLEKDLRQSLTDPDGDFVVIAPPIASNTRMMTEEELRRIQMSGGDDEYDDEDDDEDDDDDEERERAKRLAAQKKKKKADPGMSKVAKILTVVAAVIVVFVIVFLLGKAMGLFSGASVTSWFSSKRVEVPELVGMDINEAEDLMDDLGLRLKVVSEVESRTQEKDHIESQRTAKGAKMPENAIVQVVVSTGKLVQIPNLTGKDYIDARDELLDLGFAKKNIKIKKQHSDKYDDDEVISTDPKSGKWLSKSKSVTVYVSSGVEMVKVPNVVGRTQEAAEKALADAGLVADVTLEYSEDYAEGKVFNQNPSSGAQVEKGEKVKIYVSQGERGEKEGEPVRIGVNILNGKSRSQVMSQLRSLGFTFGDDILSQSSEEEGTVLDIKYIDEDTGDFVSALGKELPEGTILYLEVSTGPGGE